MHHVALSYAIAPIAPFARCLLRANLRFCMPLPIVREQEPVCRAGFRILQRCPCCAVSALLLHVAIGRSTECKGCSHIARARVRVRAGPHAGSRKTGVYFSARVNEPAHALGVCGYAVPV